ncbi:MAG: nucleotidyl transferase AbiEii/AbiGii toxin family protein [Nannocystaceae bacterium]|nr:nucleotidyl transferase AbiEii/AbiGii toxin family protein [Nannocystaceae bacterium]
MTKSASDLVALAEEVNAILEELEVNALLIGGAALAAHNYARTTTDIDLGVSTPLAQLRKVSEAIEAKGLKAELREPDGDDHLSGVVDVEGGAVQIVNFGETFPAAIQDALREAPPYDGRLRAISLPYLIVLKVYAGLGPKSRRDVEELLLANPDADRQAIRALCSKYRLRGWHELI